MYFKNGTDQEMLPSLQTNEWKRASPLVSSPVMSSLCLPHLGPSLHRQPGERRRKARREQQGQEGADGLHQGAAAGARGRVRPPQLPDPAPQIRDRGQPGPLRAAGGPGCCCVLTSLPSHPCLDPLPFLYPVTAVPDNQPPQGELSEFH